MLSFTRNLSSDPHLLHNCALPLRTHWMKYLCADTQNSGHKQAQIMFAGGKVLGYWVLPGHICHNPIEIQVSWQRSSPLQKRNVRVRSVDRAAELAGVCHDYQTLALSLPKPGCIKITWKHHGKYKFPGFCLLEAKLDLLPNPEQPSHLECDCVHRQGL